MSDNFNNNEDLNQTEEQPWERKFGEEENLKNRQFSRSARNSGGKAVAPLSNVVLFVFLIVIVAPFLFMMWFYISNNSNQVKPRTADDVMLTKTVETTTVSGETTAATTKQEATTAANEATTTAPRQAEQTTQAQQTQQTPTTQAQQQNGNYGTYTVKAGDTLYRIAVNHGMDVATLKQINGLTGDNIAPGTTLKVAQ